MKYPIGTQTFADVINAGCVYVDKTAHVYKLAHCGKKFFFLSRPRRFGKSLFLSTLKAYFSGQRELFKGLAIDGMETEWTAYPVLHIDMNAETYDTPSSLDARLDRSLRTLEETYGEGKGEHTFATRLEGIIRRAHEQTGKQVVILIDEYDKPMLAAVGNDELMEAYRRTLKGFYSVLKAMDSHIRFCFLTGVTKFSKVSVFSDLNNLRDLSMNRQYADICGISEAELHAYFDEQIHELAQAQGMTYEEACDKLRLWYDGYHFAEDTPGIYNPWSVLCAMDDQQIKQQWAETGTPTFLINLIRNTSYDLNSLQGCEVSSSLLSTVDTMLTEPIPVIYQAGYLTIRGYDKVFDRYTLGFPNREVEKNWLVWLVPAYFRADQRKTEFFIYEFVRDMMAGRIDALRKRMEAFFADISYDLRGDLEVNWQNMMYILFKLMGMVVRVEYRTSNGRIDMMVTTQDDVYVFEIKRDGDADAALAQIDTKGYMIPFQASGRRLHKIGINFNTTTRRIDGWRQVSE